MSTQEPFKTLRALSRLPTLLALASVMLPASSLFVGFNTLTPVQVYDTSGKYLHDFGPAGAIAAFPGSAAPISRSAQLAVLPAAL